MNSLIDCFKVSIPEKVKCNRFPIRFIVMKYVRLAGFMLMSMLFVVLTIKKRQRKEIMQKNASNSATVGFTKKSRANSSIRN